MVEDRVGIDLDTGCLEGRHRGQIVGLGSIFCTNRTFLIELAQIKHVVHTVANITTAANALISRRQPQRRNTSCRQLTCPVGNLFPQVAIVGRIPVEILHHDTVSFYHAMPPLNLARCDPQSHSIACCGTVLRQSPGLLAAFFSTPTDPDAPASG